MATVELAATYAALILADDGVEITADRINQLTSAAKIDVEPIWASLLAKALAGRDVKEMLMNVGAGGGAPAVGGGGAAPAAAAGGAPAAEAPAEEAKEEKKEEEKEESDDDMGFGLFD